MLDSMAGEIARLRARIEELEEEIRQLRAAAAPVYRYRGIHLEPQTLQLLNIIYARYPKAASYEHIIANLSRRQCDDWLDPRAYIKSQTCNLRKDIAPLKIETVRSHGYVLTAAAFDALTNLRTAI